MNGVPEKFDRTLTGASTKNDFFDRPVTYANIPALPNAIGVNVCQKKREKMEGMTDDDSKQIVYALLNFLPFLYLGLEECNWTRTYLGHQLYSFCICQGRSKWYEVTDQRSQRRNLQGQDYHYWCRFRTHLWSKWKKKKKEMRILSQLTWLSIFIRVLTSSYTNQGKLT